MWITLRLYAMHRTECLSSHSVFSLIFLVGLSGCGGSDDPNKGINVKPTVHLTGKVLVDGVAPDTPVTIKAHLVGDAGGNQPLSSGGTGKDGVFGLNTYNSGDGLPPGEYKLTFLWTELRLGSAALGGGRTDKLGGQYADPKTSQFTVKVTESKDVLDIGAFELKKAATPTKIKDDRN